MISWFKDRPVQEDILVYSQAFEKRSVRTGKSHFDSDSKWPPFVNVFRKADEKSFALKSLIHINGTLLS